MCNQALLIIWDAIRAYGMPVHARCHTVLSELGELFLAQRKEAN